MLVFQVLSPAVSAKVRWLAMSGESAVACHERESAVACHEREDELAQPVRLQVEW
jgi:hypothetical protein